MRIRKMSRPKLAGAGAAAAAAVALLISSLVQTGGAPDAAAASPAAAASAAGTIASGSAPSSAVGGSVNFNIYLPAGYATSTKQYPSLYLLHGRGDTMAAWTREKADLDRLIADGSIPPMIVVMPNAPWEGGGSWYVNSEYTGAKYKAVQAETAITVDLVKYVDSHYRTINNRDARAIGGYSMGGFGALRYVLAHQDEFAAAIVLSPAVYTPLPPGLSSSRDYGAFGVGSSLFVDSRYKALNYPALLKSFDPSLPVHVFFAVGDKDTYVDPGATSERHSIELETVLAYNRVIRVKGITAALRVLGGGHNWDVWQPAFVEGIQNIAPYFNGNPAATMKATLLGTPGPDWAGGVVADSDGGATLAMSASGPIDGQHYSGGLDTVVMKVGSDGSPVWTTEFGNSADQRPYGIAAGPDGRVYVGGYTDGNLDGHHANNTGNDPFVAAINADGGVAWIKQFGDPNAADRIYAVGADPSGGVYVAGYTKGSVNGSTANVGSKDVFAAHLSATGSITWITQFGSAGEDKAFAVTAFDGGVAVAGVAGAAMPGQSSPGAPDGYVAALSGTGSLRWIRQIGSSGPDLFSGIIATSSGLVAVGQFSGNVSGTSAGGLDALAVDLNDAGTVQWKSQWGTSANDQASQILPSGDGGFVVIGSTGGRFTSAVGGYDIFVSHLSADGKVLGTTQFGTTANDGISAYDELNLYGAASPTRLWVTGATDGNTAKYRNAGKPDVFVYSKALGSSQPPPPTTVAASVDAKLGPEGVQVGQAVTDTATVTNTGTKTIGKVTVTFYPADHLEGHGGDRVFKQIQGLAPGNTAKVSATYTAASAGAATQKVRANADGKVLADTHTPALTIKAAATVPAASDVKVTSVDPGKAKIAFYPQVYPYKHNTITTTDVTDPAAPVITKTTESSGAWVTGLTDGDVYQVVVTTTSAAGTSAPSKPVTLHTVPAAANDLRVVGTGSGKAKVAYFPQRHSDSKVLRYTLTATDKTDPAAPAITVRTQANSAWISGLIGGHVYQVTETTTSTAGTSAPSRPVTFSAGS